MIRLHSKQTKEAVALRDAKRERYKDQEREDRVVDEEAGSLEDLATARLVYNTYKNANTYEHSIRDKRLRDYQLSLGYRMLKNAGVLDNKEDENGAKGEDVESKADDDAMDEDEPNTKVKSAGWNEEDEDGEMMSEEDEEDNQDQVRDYGEEDNMEDLETEKEVKEQTQEMPSLADDAPSKLGRWSRFKGLYRLFERGTELNKEQMTNFDQERKRLCDATLAEADVVCCTLACAGEAGTYDNFKPDVIGVDEAARPSEPDMWTVLGPYSAAPLVMVGDQRQLRPMVKSSSSRDETRKNNFAAQLGTSLFQRLILAGHPHNMFNLQYRMAPAIGSLVSRSFYNGRLGDGNGGKEREGQTQAKNFNFSRFQVRNCLSMISVKDAEPSTEQDTHSKFNHVMMAAALDLLHDML